MFRHQYDTSSYLFTSPTFISLDPAPSQRIVVKGIRIASRHDSAWAGLQSAQHDVHRQYTRRTLSSVRTSSPSRAVLRPIFLSFDHGPNHRQSGSSIAPVDVRRLRRSVTTCEDQFASRRSRATTTTLRCPTYATCSSSCLDRPESLLGQSVGVAQLAIQYCMCGHRNARSCSRVTFTPRCSERTNRQDDSVTSPRARVLGNGLTTSRSNTVTANQQLIGKPALRRLARRWRVSGDAAPAPPLGSSTC